MSERRVELTSSAWLFNPERLFWIAGQINKTRSPDARIGVELYPVHYFMGGPFGPGRISSDTIHAWQKEHGPVPVERIHLPFHYNLSSALYNYFGHSVFKEPGTLKDRAIATAVGYMTTTVQNRFATNLAGDFNAGLNAHVNIIEEAGKRNTMAKVRGNSRYVWVENDLDYPRKKPEQFEAERDPERAFRAVERHGLEGVIYGADHAFRFGADPADKFDEHKEGFDKHLRVIHLSGSEGDHPLIEDTDHKFWDFISFVRERISDEVRFCLDLDPLQMRKLSPDVQLEYVNNLVLKLGKFS